MILYTIRITFLTFVKQAYGIVVAECALVFFKNGEPAYITKRFDYAPDGRKIAQEDFASISGMSKEKDGEGYNNNGSYEDIRIGMLENRIRAILEKYRNKNQKVLTLTLSSFLTEPVKQLYVNHYIDRLKMLNTSFSRSPLPEPNLSRVCKG